MQFESEMFNFRLGKLHIHEMVLHSIPCRGNIIKMWEAVRAKSFESEANSICSRYLKELFLSSRLFPSVTISLSIPSPTVSCFLVLLVRSRLFLFHIVSLRKNISIKYGSIRKKQIQFKEICYISFPLANGNKLLSTLQLINELSFLIWTVESPRALD